MSYIQFILRSNVLRIARNVVVVDVQSCTSRQVIVQCVAVKYTVCDAHKSYIPDVTSQLPHAL